MKLGLQARYAIAIPGLVAAIAISLLLAMYFQHQSHHENLDRESNEALASVLRQRTEIHVKGLVDRLAASLENPLYKFDLREIRDLAQSVRHHPEIVYVHVFDGQGRIVHDGTDEAVTYGTVSKDPQTLALLRSGQASVLRDDQNVHIAGPIAIGGQLLGGVKVGYSIAAIAADIKGTQKALRDVNEAATGRYVTAALAIAALLSLCGIALGIAVARRLTKPIKELKEMAQQLSRGNYELSEAKPRADEIGELRTAFTEMAAEIERQHRALTESGHDLERRINERTAELGEANETLRRSDATRRKLFQDISHELRTPLTIIRGEADVTRRGAEKSAPEYRKALKRISDFAGELSHFVDDLMIIARSDTDALRLRKTTLNLNKVLSDLCQACAVLAGQRRVTVSFQSDGDALHIRADRRRVNQIFMVLIDNAVKYSHPESTVRISAVAEKDWARISVRGTGPGIAVTELEKIFERFYRGGVAQDMAPGGTGLGLAVAKSLTEAHGGAIEVSSTPNVETTLTVSLPMGANGGVKRDDFVDRRRFGDSGHRASRSVGRGV